ncbi:AbrB/MazE/SpoVT family DNA-binding domain-containing protein [Nanoarchaeota archaeon]
MTNSNPEQRKLIRFGNSSYIIAIPKPWISKNKLKKGDLLFVEETPNNELIIKTKADKSKETKTIDIDIGGKDINSIERELTSVYINNYSEINITGKNLNQRSNAITKAVQDKIGLEISDQNNEKIIIKDILDLEAISLEKTIRRLDNMIRAIFEEIGEGVNSGKIKDWTLKEIYSIDQGINKFYFLSWKLIRKCQEDPRILSKFKLDSRKLSDIQWVVLHLEQIGDELKRLAKILHNNGVLNQKELSLALNDLEKSYVDMINSYYNKDLISARKLATRKKERMDQYEKLFFSKSNNIKKGTESVVEKLKSLTGSIHNISRVIGYYL